MGLSIMKIVLPFDGSPSAARAVDYVVGMAEGMGGRKLAVDLVNVQEAAAGVAGLMVRDAAELAERLTTSCLEEGKRLLAGPIEKLERANVAVRPSVPIGDPATEIAGHVVDSRADAVVMGTRGLGAVGGLVLGSVASKVVHLVKVPVTLVK
jgi:nucleotide-binding universal stress UspA family protein